MSTTSAPDAFNLSTICCATSNANLPSSMDTIGVVSPKIASWKVDNSSLIALISSMSGLSNKIFFDQHHRSHNIQSSAAVVVVCALLLLELQYICTVLVPQERRGKE